MRKAKDGDRYYRVNFDSVDRIHVEAKTLYYIITKNKTLLYWEKYEKKWYIYPYKSFRVDEAVSMLLNAQEVTREHMVHIGMLEE